MNDLNFEVKNNTVVVHLTDEQMNFGLIVKQGSEQMTGEYKPIVSIPNTSTEVKVLDLPWKNAPKPGEEYDVMGCAQDSKTQNWGDWSVQRWTAPGKAKLVPRIKNPTTPAAAEPPAVPNPIPILTASPDPDPILNPPTDEQSNSVIAKINERLNVINKDLDEILEIFRIKAVPPQNQKYLLRVEETLGSILMAMGEIAVQVKEVEKTSPDNYKQVSDKFEACREKAKKASRLSERARDLSAKKYPTQQPAPVQVPTPVATTATPTPATAAPVVATAPVVPATPTNVAATTPVVAPVIPATPAAAAPAVDLDPINDRINNLEQQLKDVNDQLADKASSDDLTALSERVDGLTGQVSNLDTKVGVLAGNCKDGFAALEEKLTSVSNAITNAMTTTTATAATPAPATATPVVATAPVVPATPTNVAPTTPVVAPATANTTATPPETKTTQVKKGDNVFWKMTLMYGLLVVVFGLTITGILGIIFSAPRPQQTTPIIVVPANTTTSPEATVTPVTPPSAPAPLPRMSPEELEKKRAEIRAQQESVLGAHPNLAVRSYDSTKPSQEGSAVSINGNGNVVGKNVTINNNYQDPKTDSDMSGSYVPSTFHTSNEVGPRLVRTGHWSPTREVNTVQIENPFGLGTGYSDLVLVK